MNIDLTKLFQPPFDLQAFLFDNGFKILLYNDAQHIFDILEYKPDSDSAAAYINGAPYIFVKDKSNPVKYRMYLAHELGHFVYGHIKNNEIVKLSEKEEIEAKIFAANAITQLLKSKFEYMGIWDRIAYHLDTHKSVRDEDKNILILTGKRYGFNESSIYYHQLKLAPIEYDEDFFDPKQNKFIDVINPKRKSLLVSAGGFRHYAFPYKTEYARLKDLANGTQIRKPAKLVVKQSVKDTLDYFSWRFLIDENITSMPIDYKSIAGAYGWTVLPYSLSQQDLGKAGINTESKSSLVLFLGDRVMILYDDTLPPDAQQSEISYAFWRAMLNRYIRQRNLTIEAKYISIITDHPRALLYELLPQTPVEVQRLCGTDNPSAALGLLIFIEEFKKERIYNGSELEFKLREQFEELIKKYRK